MVRSRTRYLGTSGLLLLGLLLLRVAQALVVRLMGRLLEGAVGGLVEGRHFVRGLDGIAPDVGVLDDDVVERHGDPSLFGTIHLTEPRSGRMGQRTWLNGGSDACENQRGGGSVRRQPGHHPSPDQARG